MENQNAEKSHLAWINVIIIFLLTALLAMLIWFALDVRVLYKTGVLSPAISRIRRRSLNRPTFTAAQIQDWMTFRYIQYVFHLPPNYLPGKLKITDTDFLNMTLAKYAVGHKLSSAAFAQSVRDAVANYQVSNKP